MPKKAVKAIRVQLRRTKGWKMPPNTVKVDRTTKWGNPFRVGPGRTQAYSVEQYTHLMGGWICLCESPDGEEQMAALKYARTNIEKLRGKNLACWCPLDKPCHADVLLELANARPSGDGAP